MVCWTVLHDYRYLQFFCWSFRSFEFYLVYKPHVKIHLDADFLCLCGKLADTRKRHAPIDNFSSVMSILIKTHYRYLIARHTPPTKNITPAEGKFIPNASKKYQKMIKNSNIRAIFATIWSPCMHKLPLILVKKQAKLLEQRKNPPTHLQILLLVHYMSHPE